MLRASNGLTIFTFERLPSDGVVHGVSTRLGGVSPPPYASLNHSLLVRDEPERVRENCRRFADALGFPVERMAMGRQVHGDDVLAIDEVGAGVGTPLSAPEALPSADIQVTDRPGWLLSLRFADCVPLLVVHPRRRVVAAVHAGWRGTLKGAAATAVGALAQRYGAAPGGLWVGIGPAIGPCCYEVGEEVAMHFDGRANGVIRDERPRPHLDLWEINRQVVVETGVPAEQIEVAGLCTRCRSDLFFSHRAEGFPGGRFSAAVGLV